jgi:hypothetical protein
LDDKELDEKFRKANPQWEPRYKQVASPKRTTPSKEAQGDKPSSSPEAIKPSSLPEAITPPSALFPEQKRAFVQLETRISLYLISCQK